MPSKPLPPDDPRHGTFVGYTSGACRCADCREANREYQSRYRARVKKAGLLTGPEVQHGTHYRYNIGCRCDECREAHNAYSRKIKARLRARKATGNG